MKKFFSFVLLLAALALTTAVRAQVINGDLNHNDVLDVGDVTMVIDGYLTGETETISANADPYMVDNSRIVGSWRDQKGEIITLNADGTMAGAEDGYMFMPYQGEVLILDAKGKPMMAVKVVYISDDYVVVRTGNGNEVEVYQACTVVNGHEAVDLGLSVKWATMNIGASSPEDYGDSFAWGETTPKSTYGWETYKWCNGSYTTMTKYCISSSYGTVDNKTVLDLADDAANANWGGSWRMPTKAEQDELDSNCTWEWTTQNGVNGYKVTSKTNGNSIFLPAAGCRYDSSLYGAGSSGHYWSSSLYADNPLGAWYLRFNSGNFYMSSGDRCYGRSVRAVCP